MNKVQKFLIILGAILAGFAVVTQFVIMLENRDTPMTETLLRFFSFFTILTNSMIAIYFTTMWLGKNSRLGHSLQQAGHMTAICVYITVVGLVYQLLLRHVWEPQGMQKLVDELLHSIIPLYFIVYWYLYEEKEKLQWSLIPPWLIYPLMYVILILIRGSFSDFYPYPFVNVSILGMNQVLLNCLGLTVIFIGFSMLYISIGKLLLKAQHK